MTALRPVFIVMARDKAGVEQVLHRFSPQPGETAEGAHERAINHALGADMRYWDDVWVMPQKEPAPEDWAPPRQPFAILWTGNGTHGGFAYLVDADGRKIASLLGNQRTREHVAALLHDAGLCREDGK